MIKLNETYQYKENDLEIKFDVEYAYKDGTLNPPTKKVRIEPSQQSGWSSGQKGFVFNRSSPATINKIGQALLDIGKFVEKL